MTVLDNAFGPGADLTLSLTETAVPDAPLIHRLIKVHEAGIRTTEAIIERQGERVDLVPTAPRGGVAQSYAHARPDAVRVQACHLPVRSSVFADEVQDMRAFGHGDSESPERLRERKLRAMKKNLITTLSRHALGAIKGQVLDADGSVLLDQFSLWNVAQQTVSFDMADAGTNLLTKGVEVQRRSEDAFGADVVDGFIGVASPSFMDQLRAHAYYEKVLQYAEPSKLMADYRTGIQIGGITFVECRSPADWPGGIEDGSAYVVPNSRELIIRRYAPADWVETVNTEGVPFYAKSEPMPMGRGYFLEAQTNPITVCTRPRAVIKVTAE